MRWMASAMVRAWASRLDDAGTGDEEEPARADLHRPDFKRVAHEGDSTLPGVGWRCA